LVNTTTTEDWNVTLTVEPDLAGNAAVADTFADAGTDGGDADIWLFTSQINSSAGAVTEIPNPGLYGSLTQWLDNSGTGDIFNAIQLEVANSVLSVANAVTGPFVIPAGEQRQLGLVVDCGANMQDEAVAGTTGTFRMTVATSPN